jgi:mannose-6-phosphate isomerase-like protein (cupin superfamily)
MRERMRIVEKPWGYEEIWAETSRYVGKLLHINKGHRLSRQYHEKKEETIRVTQGDLTIEVGSGPVSVYQYGIGSTFHVDPGTVHRFCAYKNDVEIIEVSTPELDDVVRLDDDYSR